METRLTPREKECLRWTADGKRVDEVAAILGISRHTVRDHMKAVRRKLECATSAQAVGKAVERGLLGR